MSTIALLKKYAAGEISYASAYDALVTSGSLTPVGAADVLADPVKALDEFAGVFDLMADTLQSLADDASLHREERRAAKELLARADALPPVWDQRF
jgi:hypothetical protein